MTCVSCKVGCSTSVDRVDVVDSVSTTVGWTVDWFVLPNPKGKPANAPMNSMAPI